MNKKSGAWITIICILVIGLSVTKITETYIQKRSGESVSVMSLADAGTSDLSRALNTEGAAAGAAAEADAGGAQPAGGARAARSADSEETDAEAFEEAGEEEAAEKAAEKAAADEGVGPSVLETVKSPLDPAVKENSDGTSKSAAAIYSYDELSERLETASAQVKAIGEALQDSSPGALYGVAEQQWNIWDTERNLLYSAILQKMNDEEAEKLRRDEVEWVKGRDAAADKARLKSSNQSSQNVDYMKVCAKKTEERCYQLLSDYEEILKRDDTE